jgi:RNA polymerase sigma-70 factor (ECF subfamily)
MSDAALVRLAVEEAETSRGRSATAVLLCRYRMQIYRWCYRLVRDHEGALDLSQEILLSVHRNLHRFAGRSQFSSWLFSIVRNRCVSAMRRPSLLYEEDVELDGLADPRAPVDAALEESEEMESVLELMRAHLDPLEQRALCLRCFEQMPVNAITKILGIAQASGARGVLQSARRKLRAVLVDPRTRTGGGREE